MKQKKVHLIGIGGSAMSNLALMFAKTGWYVIGSDQNVYPPASNTLLAQGIDFFQGYDAQHITADLDLIVVGNVVSRGNVEVQEMLRKDLPFVSMPGALFDIFMQDKQRIAVCGTHGKTTTTSLLAWVYDQAGHNPSYFVGGVPINFAQGYRLGEGKQFVIEGDEYDTAYFEKTPKFLHYHPQHIIITSIEFDHADIYRDFTHVYQQFERLVSQMPKDGTVIVCTDQASVRKLAEDFPGCISYGRVDADWTYHNQEDLPQGQAFDVFYQGKNMARVQTHLLGEHNRLNILSAFAQAHVHGLDMQQVADAVASFEGVKKRQQRIGEVGGVAIYEDFAHHPSAIASTIKGFMPMCKARGGRLIVALEPRSNTMRRKIFETTLADSFNGADLVYLSRVFQKNDQLQAENMLDPSAVVAKLRANGISGAAPENVDELLALLQESVQANDVVVFMSNGDFSQAASKLLHQLS